jgi:hypothetical protein
VSVDDESRVYKDGDDTLSSPSHVFYPQDLPETDRQFRLIFPSNGDRATDIITVIVTFSVCGYAKTFGTDGPHGRFSNSKQEEKTTMDHTNHVRLTTTELTPAVLEGATVYGADDHKVGKVDHIHGVGAGGKAIIDVGGFLGIGAKPVAVPLSDLDFMRDEDGDIHAVTAWTKDQLKDMPEHHH